MRTTGLHDVFGTINPSTGTFTQLGSASFAAGYYVLVYDPLHNFFYTTDFFYTTGEPIGAVSTNQIEQIDASTGAVTTTLVNATTITGLGVATSPSTSVPEPGTLALLGVGLAGLAFSR